jgi:hypothetical protein
MRDASHHRRDPTHSHELGRATRRIHAQTRYRDDIRRTDDALGRGAPCDFQDKAYSLLMSGPSGSADIGGVTVHPAQGVMTLTVIFWSRIFGQKN